MPRLPALQTTAAALNVVFMRVDFLGALSVRSCSYEKWFCRGGGEPACLVFLVISFFIFVCLFVFFMCCGCVECGILAPWFCLISFCSFLFLRNVALSWGWRACLYV